MKDLSRLTKLPERVFGPSGRCNGVPVLESSPAAGRSSRTRPPDCAWLKLCPQLDAARQKIEQLLTDFTVDKARSAPSMPLYRLEEETDSPRILPVVGKLPLPQAALQAVPLVEETGPFRLVKFSGEGAWVPVPGWQVILNAEDPVVLISDSDRLASPSTRQY